MVIFDLFLVCGRSLFGWVRHGRRRYLDLVRIFFMRGRRRNIDHRFFDGLLFHLRDELILIVCAFFGCRICLIRYSRILGI